MNLRHPRRKQNKNQRKETRKEKKNIASCKTEVESKCTEQSHCRVGIDKTFSTLA